MSSPLPLPKTSEYAMKPKKPTKPPDTETSSILSNLEGYLSPTTLDALAQAQKVGRMETPSDKDERAETTGTMTPKERLDVKTLSMLAAIASQGTTKTPSQAVDYAWQLWQESNEVLQ